ncbi:MAG: hypothetical protein K2K21_09465, partial [Lachnospiraceae bacterium]|nr:hypothetical protein [Lachnospiraceae bacterium]
MDKEKKKGKEVKADREEKKNRGGEESRKEKTDKEENGKRIVGKVFIGFVVITVLLTFFSKSLYSYRLPVVTVTSPKQGKLDFSVEGAAKISYAQSTPYYPEMDGKIK